MKRSHQIDLGVAVMAADDVLLAQLPLFEAGRIDVIEWNPDGPGDDQLPNWLVGLLNDYASRNALLGHAVDGSLASVTERGHSQWLQRVDRATSLRRYRQLSEHMGCANAGRQWTGAPLPMPWSSAVVDVVSERLDGLAQRTGLPVGLEPLALAGSAADALAQAECVAGILERTDGWLLLDLHNLWCQIETHGIPPMELWHRLPLDRVREVHLAGGRFDEHDSPGLAWRRDTHDQSIPDAVIELVAEVLPHCPNVTSVVVERIPGSLTSDEDRMEYLADFDRVEQALSSIQQLSTNGQTVPESFQQSVKAILPDLPQGVLAECQCALVEALCRGQAWTECRGLAAEQCAHPVWQNWLASIDSQAWRVMQELVIRWGRDAVGNQLISRD